MSSKNNNVARKDFYTNLVGWVLFIACALMYMESSYRNWDLITFLGSLLFLIACIVFLLPFIRVIRQGEIPKGDD
ncbi:MAG: cell division protein FtsW (lipid II flippase) [Saprospiraceae bacterium]|jgi:cell division protein FtsW (lipid II flippase)